MGADPRPGAEQLLKGITVKVEWPKGLDGLTEKALWGSFSLGLLCGIVGLLALSWALRGLQRR